MFIPFTLAQALEIEAAMNASPVGSAPYQEAAAKICADIEAGTQPAEIGALDVLHRILAR